MKRDLTKNIQPFGADVQVNLFATLTKRVNHFAILFVLMVSTFGLQAQTVLINPAAEGGFELGPTFADNGWTVANSANNPWVLGTGVSGAPWAGNVAYISNNSGTSNAYTLSGAITENFFYRDVTFPAGETSISLSFNWLGTGETIWDLIQVFVAPVSTPVAATTTYPGSGFGVTSLVGATYIGGLNLQATAQTVTLNIPSSAVGNCTAPTTRRLIFAWKNDGGGGGNPSGTVDNISLVSSVLSPASSAGPFTIDNTLPNAGTNFSSFTNAINWLSSAVGCSNNPIIFNVAAGQTFTETPPAITVSGTSANPIIFQKSGVGANPIVSATGGAGTVDAAISINGGDYITFDGIDVSIASGSALEYGYQIRNASATSSANFNTIKNCKVTLNRTNTNSIGVIVTSSTTGGGVTPTASSGSNSDNTILSVQVENAYAGIFVTSGAAGFPGFNNIVSGTLASPTVVGAAYTGIPSGSIGGGTTPTYGIQFNNQENFTISNSVVQNIVNTTGIIRGIYTLGSRGNNFIHNNVVRGFYRNSTTSTAAINGMDISLSTSAGDHFANVYNNMVSDLTVGYTGSASGTRAVKGILLGSGTATSAYNISHNSVSIDGSGSPNLSNVCIELGGTTAANNIRNNVFANFTGAQTGVAKHFVIRSTSATAVGSNVSVTNNNDYYIANTSNGFVGLLNTTDAATIANWTAGLTATPGTDVNTISANPNFVNNITDLHINAAIPTQLESYGIQLNILNDIDGNIRQGQPGYAGAGTLPDLGADEGEFIGLDLTAPLISHSLPVLSCATGDRTYTATISDLSGVPTSGVNIPRVYYRKNGGSWFSQPGTLVSGTSLNGTWDFTVLASDMGGLVGNDTIKYYFIAQDLATTPNVVSLPAGVAASDVNTVTTPPAVPFTQIVGATLAGTFTVGTGGDFTTLTAAVAAYNNSCLTGPVVFNLTDAAYPSEVFPITVNANLFSSAVNTLTIRPAAGASPVITGTTPSALIKLNGADYVTIDGSNSGTNTRDLSLENTNSGTSSSVVWIASTLTNGATNNTVKNVVAKGNAPTTTFGVLLASGSGVGAVAEFANTNTRFENNLVSKAQYGIVVVGPTGNESGTVITKNNIGSTLAGDKIGLRGIGVFQQQNVDVSENNISGITRAATDNGASGIFIGGTFSGGNVNRNKISDVVNTNTGGYAASGVLLNSSSPNTGLTISNNFVSNVTAYGWASNWTDNSHGIYVLTGGGYNVHYNTVWMNLNQTIAANTSAIFFASAASTGLDVRNNIFVNTLTTGARNAIYSLAPNTSFTVINNNDYFSSQNVGFLTSQRATLSDWQTATGQDGNSINVLPVFTSATDLHLALASNLPLLDKGVVVTVTNDIDGQPRGTSPDMGADEFGDRPATPVSLTQTVVTPSCTGGTALYALPAAPANVVYYLQNAATDTAVANPFVGDSIIVFTNGTYFVRAKNTVTNLWSTGSASVVVNNVPVAPLPPSPVADASPACLTTNLTVPAPTNPNVTFYWQGTIMGGTSTALNASSPFAVSASGTYYVSAFDASSNCWSNTNSVAVVIDTFVPNAPSTGPNASVCTGVSSVELTASTPAPGSVQAVFGTNISSSGLTPVVLNATLPAIPAGATITSTQLLLTNVNAINGSYRSEIRVQLSGITTLAPTQISALASGGLITPDPVINVPNGPSAGGAVTLTISESFDDLNVIDATFGEAKIVVNYTIPASTVTWWDAASAGNQLGSGSPLQTVGTGLLPNTNTPGTYTFYAQANSVACTSTRVPVIVTVNPLPVVDAGTAFTACPLSPITLTATGANTYVWNNGVTNGLAFPAPNVTTLYTVTGTDANLCSSTDTITVFALPTTAVSITPSGPITTCQNQPVELTANGPAPGPSETITQWNFNNSDLTPNEGTGTFLLIGGVTPSYVSSTGSSDPVSGAVNALNTTSYPAQGTNPKTAGVQMNVSTAGYSNINFSFDVRHSGTAANTYVVQYNPDITNVLSPWIDAQTFVYSTSGSFINNQTVNLSSFPATNNNPNLGLRVVSAFDQTSGSSYVGTTGTYGTSGTVRYDMVTLSGQPAGATYLWTGGATTPNFTPTTSGTYVVTVTQPNGVCPGYDSVQVTVNPVPTTTLNPVICANQTYTLANGDIVNTTNIYTRTLASVATGCDSIVVVNLTVNPTYNNTVPATICSNESYTLANGTVVTAAGSYTVTVPSIANCDSTVTVNLTVLPAQLINVTASICANEDYTLPNGTVVTAANTYTNVFTAANGCDSTIVTVLSVKPVFTSTQNPVICDGDLQTMPDGTTQGVQGTYVFPYTAINGCDSTITVNLAVNPVFTTNLTVDICVGDSYTLANGTIVNSTNVYTTVVPAITGCDSTVVVNLTVRPDYAINTNAAICAGETYTLVNGVVVSQAGTYTSGTSSIFGCDSVVTVVLTVNPVFNQTVSASICEGEDYKLPNGNTVTASGSYTSNLQSVFGCDSIVVTNLTVNPLPVVNLGADQALLNPPVVLNAGVGFTTYDWSTGATTQTITVTQNGTYGVTVTNQFGCEGSDEVTIYFTASIANLGNNGGSINIFPNPATDVFTVNVNGYTDGGNLKLDLVNGLGQVVRTEMVSNVNESFSKMIDVYDLAPGTYTLMVKGTSAEAALRLIIVK